MFRFYLHSFIFVRATCCCPTIRHICAWMDLTLTYIDYLNRDPAFSPLFVHDTLETFAGSQLFPQRTEITLAFRVGLPVEISSSDQSIGTSKLLISNDRYIFSFLRWGEGGRECLWDHIIDYILVAIFFFFLLFWSCILFLFPLRACWNGSIVISWWIACFAQHDPARSARTIYDYHTTRCMLFISYYFITRYIFFFLPPLVK